MALPLKVTVASIVFDVTVIVPFLAPSDNGESFTETVQKPLTGIDGVPPHFVPLPPSFTSIEKSVPDMAMLLIFNGPLPIFETVMVVVALPSYGTLAKSYVNGETEITGGWPVQTLPTATLVAFTSGV